MKFLSTLTTALFAGLALAAPTKLQITISDAEIFSLAPIEDTLASPNVTIALTNDFSGANARAQFPADSSTRAIKDLYAHTVIDAGGFQVSSAMLTQIPSGLVCVFRDGKGGFQASLTTTVTFAGFGGTKNVQGWTVRCGIQ